MSAVKQRTQVATAYPTQRQHERWKSRAEYLDMSFSEFVQAMVEVGIKIDKGFEIGTEDDRTIKDLKRQRDVLREEVLHYRNRIEKLENQLYRDELTVVQNFIRENPGCTYPKVIQHIIDTVPERIVRIVEILEGDSILIDNGEYYPLESKSEVVVNE